MRPNAIYVQRTLQRALKFFATVAFNFYMCLVTRVSRTSTRHVQKLQSTKSVLVALAPYSVRHGDIAARRMIEN